MLKRCVVAALLSLLFSYAWVYGNERTLTFYKTMKLNQHDVAISCRDGSPETKVIEDIDPTIVIVSCK